MITLKRIPENYKHPMGWDTGDWGIYEDTRLIVTGALIDLIKWFNQVRCV